MSIVSYSLWVLCYELALTFWFTCTRTKLDVLDKIFFENKSLVILYKQLDTKKLFRTRYLLVQIQNLKLHQYPFIYSRHMDRQTDRVIPIYTNFLFVGYKT